MSRDITTSVCYRNGSVQLFIQGMSVNTQAVSGDTFNITGVKSVSGINGSNDVTVTADGDLNSNEVVFTVVRAMGPNAAVAEVISRSLVDDDGSLCST
ncbi:MAG: hypothetical protein JKX81_07275 [Arenicella sp.]|nr:hypothetical protein [Arenicella sp.]